MAHDQRISTSQPLLLSVADVARVLGVCRQMVYNFIYFESLPTIKVRGVRRVHPDSLQKWLEEREHQLV
jgi:excisionase family DNA binding protein